LLLKKQELIALHESELEKWEELLAGLSMDQITMPMTPGGLSVKDTIAHLGAWLERTIARLEAALHIYELLYGYTNVYDYHHAEHRVLLEAWMRNQAEP
jgi:hypothetical protein